MKKLTNKFRPEWEPLGNDTTITPEEPMNKAYLTDLKEHQLPGYHKGYNPSKETSEQTHSEYILQGFRYQ